MIRRLMIGAVSAAALTLSTVAFAQQGQFGTAQEARALLDRAVAAVKADKDVALAMFNKDEGGFKDRDLYPFCFNTDDGKVTATLTASVMGQDVRTIKDKAGKAFGEEMYKVVKEGTTAEVSYLWPRPGTDTTPVEKVSFITKVGDQGCGVGYYK
jgi:signal transduction histidine kinase